MDKELVASELLKVAKDLVAGRLESHFTFIGPAAASMFFITSSMEVGESSDIDTLRVGSNNPQRMADGIAKALTRYYNGIDGFDGRMGYKMQDSAVVSVKGKNLVVSYTAEMQVDVDRSELEFSNKVIRDHLKGMGLKEEKM